MAKKGRQDGGIHTPVSELVVGIGSVSVVGCIPTNRQARAHRAVSSGPRVHERNVGDGTGALARLKWPRATPFRLSYRRKAGCISTGYIHLAIRRRWPLTVCVWMDDGEWIYSYGRDAQLRIRPALA